MSLRLRMGHYLKIFFLLNPNGLSLGDLEKSIELMEGKYYSSSNAQQGIIDGLDLMKKPILERRDLTKFHSYDLQPFWKFSDGKYFLEGRDLSCEERNLLEKLESGEETLGNYYPSPICEAKIIDSLEKNPEGIALKELSNSIHDFFKSLDGLVDIDHLFVSSMCFDYKIPYETVYFDRRRPEGTEYHEFSMAEDTFTDWEYKNGLYYPTEDFLNKYGKDSEENLRSRKKFMIALEDITLLGQVNGYCQLKGLTNSDFLRMHLHMQSNLEFSRSQAFQ